MEKKNKSATYQKRYWDKKKKKFEQYFSFYQYVKKRNPKLLIEFKLDTYGVPAGVERVCQKKKTNRQLIKKGTEKKRNLRNILVFTNMPKEEIQNY